MPVTAKLSKLFYERLGEEVANELVDWFNAVDATYRSDLRELNERNFQRFDAKLEQRLAELRADLLTQWRAESGHLDAKIDGVARDLHVTIERGLKEQTRFLFVAWAALLVPIIGLWFRG